MIMRGHVRLHGMRADVRGWYFGSVVSGYGVRGMLIRLIGEALLLYSFLTSSGTSPGLYTRLGAWLDWL